MSVFVGFLHVGVLHVGVLHVGVLQFGRGGTGYFFKNNTPPLPEGVLPHPLKKIRQKITQ
jgi:hypothetical protein